MKKHNFHISALALVLAAVMLLGMAAELIIVPVQAASSSEIRQQINALQAQQAAIKAQIGELDSQIDENLSEMQAVVEQKKVLDQEVFLLYSEIAVINEQISAYGVLIADKQDELDAAENRLAELTAQNRDRIRAMEEDGKLSYWSVLFKANSFSDLLDRLNMIEEIAASDTRRIRQLSEAAQAVADAQAALGEEKAALEQTKAGLDATREELSAKQEEATALLADLNARGIEYEMMMEEAEINVALLMQEIAAQEALYNAAVWEEYWATYVPPTTTAPPTTAPTSPPTTGGTTGDSSENTGSGNETGDPTTPPTTAPTTAPTTPATESWYCPIQSWYTITDKFGWRETHPIYGDRRFHYGIDMACNTGTPIYATRSGKVVAATYNSSMGYYVQISHGDGYASIYMHMTNYTVSSGQSVSRGQLIGYVGSTGDSTGPHLHFGISKNGSYVNPLEYI